MLAEGTAAPDFTVTTLRGRRVCLSEQGGTPVWLAFFRFASCPLCNYRVHAMIEQWSRFEGQRLKMLAVFQSPRSRLADFVAKQEPPFELVADPELALYEQYGLETSVLAGMTPRVMVGLAKAAASGFVPSTAIDGPPLRVPGDYLIDRGGVVRVAYRGRDISDHIPLERVEAFLAEVA